MEKSNENYKEIKKTYFYFECCDKNIIDNLEKFRECDLITGRTFSSLEDELQNIRICLIRDDKEPLFEKQRFYSTFKTVETFYKDQGEKYYLIITDNNSETYTWLEFKKIVSDSKKLNKSNKLRKRTTSTNTYDDDGYCWAGNYCF